MRVGLIMGIDDRGREPAPRWDDITAHALTAEEVGFDLITFADALTDGPLSYWEGMTMAAAVAATTRTIEIAHSTVNAPFRPPALIARTAQTLDEISGGRYTLGVGAGNTPDDYENFGVDADHRYSRFVESLTVIESLLRRGAVEFDGDYQSAHADRFVPTGPRPGRIPINVAAGGPKMLALTVRLADEWNWWTGAIDARAHVLPLLETLESECMAQGRDPSSLRRTLDVYSYDPLGAVDDPPPHLHRGSIADMAESIIAFSDLGIDEVRIDLAPAPLDRRIAAIEAMRPVVVAAHTD